MQYGYARVSTSEQENHLQLDALKAAGVERVFSEKRSSVGDRPQLRAAIAVLKPGDVLVVYKLDRVARSLKDLLTILEAIQHMGAGFRSLTEPIDTSSAVGTFIVQILGAVGQFERSLIRERAIAGQVAAYRRGVRWGGQPRAVSVGDAAEIFKLRETGLFTIPLLADIFECSESTVWRSIWIASRPDAPKLRRLPVLGAYVAA
ncbi:recombinase family protein [Caenimonas sp. S4]|nr:recombinase family protein [Caenimonas soli]